MRTVWWGLLCNLGFVGGALALGWFSNVPLWGGIFLVLFLEWGLSAMWFGLHVALRRDTRSLNRRLDPAVQDPSPACYMEHSAADPSPGTPAF